jgi:hypothetical protein
MGKVVNTVLEELSGRHGDGSPWSGVIARVHQLEGMVIQVMPEYSITTQHNLMDFTRQFARRTRHIPLLAWSGGYHLNFKHNQAGNLDETWYGIPLGLMISKGAVLSPPLFNRPSLLCDAHGGIAIRRVHAGDGFTFSCRSKSLVFPGEALNPTGSLAHELPPLCYYDLTFPGEEIPADGRVIVTTAGNVIKQIHETRRGESFRLRRTGLTLSLESDLFPATWDMRDKELSITMEGLTGIQTGVEGGPLLIENGEIVIDTEKEGWHTPVSAFLFGSDAGNRVIRRAGIVAGTDKEGNLLILYIRMDESGSVGANLQEIASILIQAGAISAMMFNHQSPSLLITHPQPESDVRAFIQELPNRITCLPDPAPVMYNMLTAMLKPAFNEHDTAKI